MLPHLQRRHATAKIEAYDIEAVGDHRSFEIMAYVVLNDGNVRIQNGIVSISKANVRMPPAIQLGRLRGNLTKRGTTLSACAFRIPKLSFRHKVADQKQRYASLELEPIVYKHPAALVYYLNGTPPPKEEANLALKMGENPAPEPKEAPAPEPQASPAIEPSLEIPDTASPEPTSTALREPAPEAVVEPGPESAPQSRLDEVPHPLPPPTQPRTPESGSTRNSLAVHLYRQNRAERQKAMLNAVQLIYQGAVGEPLRLEPIDSDHPEDGWETPGGFELPLDVDLKLQISGDCYGEQILNLESPSVSEADHRIELDLNLGYAGPVIAVAIATDRQILNRASTLRRDVRRLIEIILSTAGQFAEELFHDYQLVMGRFEILAFGASTDHVTLYDCTTESSGSQLNDVDKNRLLNVVLSPDTLPLLPLDQALERVARDLDGLPVGPGGANVLVVTSDPGLYRAPLRLRSMENIRTLTIISLARWSPAQIQSAEDLLATSFPNASVLIEAIDLEEILSTNRFALVFSRYLDEKMRQLQENTGEY